MNRRPLRLIAAAYAAAVLWATIGPAPWSTSGNQLQGGILNPAAWTAPVTWTTGYLSEIVFNIAIFIPVGLLAALLIPRRRWPLAFVAGLGFTLFIELVQVPELDRVSDPRDLVMNTAGALLGVLIVLAARFVRRAGQVAAVPVILQGADVVDAADIVPAAGVVPPTEAAVGAELVAASARPAA